MAMDGSEPAVLLVEDDDIIGRNLQIGLIAHGYPVTWQRTGSGALAEAETRPYGVVLLDLGLPDIDGLDVARDLRHRFPDILIVMLTARGDDIDVVVGLDLGADEYLVKPISLSVLLARMRALLRRRSALHDQDDEASVIEVGALVMDTSRYQCHVDGVAVKLRSKEFDLLAALCRRAGEGVRREVLMAEVWDDNWHGSTKTLDVTMAALRRALDTAASASGGTADSAPVITTLRGHGYRLERPEQASR